MPNIKHSVIPIKKSSDTKVNKEDATKVAIKKHRRSKSDHPCGKKNVLERNDKKSKQKTYVD